MNHLSKEYLILFNGITTITQEILAVAQRLSQLQVIAENEYIENGENITEDTSKEVTRV